MGSKNLKLNFAPVGLRGDTEIRVGFRPFEVDILAAPRKEFGKTHVFARTEKMIPSSIFPLLRGRSR